MESMEVDFAHILVAVATSLDGSKKITSVFRSFIYGQSSTNPANFVKIGQVDVEIISLTEITKIYFKNTTSAKHKPFSPAFAQSRWAI